MTKETVTLYYRNGSSDKVYQAAISEVDGLCMVNFAYGRRGSTLQTGTKTQSPVPYTEAKEIFDDLVKSKTTKGYSPGEDGTPYQHAENEKRDTGIRCQLANPVEDEAVDELLTDDLWWVQEKYDGKRILLLKNGQGVVGINRKGLEVGLPTAISKAAEKHPSSFVLDGECIGDKLIVFDLLMFDGRDLRKHPYKERLELLEKHFITKRLAIAVAYTARSAATKNELYRRLKVQGREGVVFKRAFAIHTPDRPASGGTWLKRKFTTTGSFIVSAINDKRSVALEVCEGAWRAQVGNVTIPINATMPPLGSVIEVRYLYAFKGGSLFQPVFLHRRDDIEPKECTIQQLKYKADDEEN